MILCAFTLQSDFQRQQVLEVLGKAGMEEMEVWKRSEASVVKRQKMSEDQMEMGTRKGAGAAKWWRNP